MKGEGAGLWARALRGTEATCRNGPGRWVPETSGPARTAGTLGRGCIFLVGAALAGCEAPATTAPASPVPAQEALALPAELPADADRSDVARQLALLRRGLYLTTAGEVRALPARYAKASWSPGAKVPTAEKADPQTDERIRILLEERPSQ